MAENRSDTRLHWASMSWRMFSGSALIAEVRSKGPPSDTWNSTSAAAAEQSFCHCVPGSRIAAD